MLQESSEMPIEKIPTREEVIQIFERYATDYRIVYEQFDQYGPVLLYIEVSGDKPGETVQYQYMRKGNFSGQPERSATTMHIVYYKDGVPTGGYNIACYIDETGQWEEQNKPL